jgi:hypothetical protein
MGTRSRINRESRVTKPASKILTRTVSSSPRAIACAVAGSSANAVSASVAALNATRIARVAWRGSPPRSALR